MSERQSYLREVISGGRVTIPSEIRDAEYYEITEESLDGEEVIILRKVNTEK
jgi:bifunctional DNA-binding transcriptional regulator/antitoxin component of YhaV-PrlF toxin-antitoxin module